MNLSFDDAIQVGRPAELVEVQRKTADAAPIIPSSRTPRGLAMRSLLVTRNWDGLWGLLRKRQQVYFLSVAFDLSASAPVVLPPKEVPGDAVFEVRRGDVIRFTLGDGAPIFPARPINGGLVVYITVCEADRGAQHVGKVLAEIHETLDKDKSITSVISGLIANPAKTALDEVLKLSTAALQPIATILKNSEDSYIGLFSGIYPAKGPWRDKLTAENNGTTIELAELR